jgi:hypothetical protein
MTTYDLRTQDVTIDELFRRAVDEAIRVITKDGRTFVIELADEFEREVALLSQSESFMAFLAERSRHKEGSISLEELEREIELELAREQEEAENKVNNQ